MELDLENFSERFSKCMIKSGYTNKKLTDELELSKNIIGNCKKNQIPNTTTLYQISQKFGTTIEYLLTGKKSNNLSEDEIELLEYYNVADNRGKRRIMCTALDEAAEQADLERTKSSESKIG